MRPGRTIDDELVNASLVGVAILAIVAATLNGAGAVAAWLCGAQRPSVDIASALRVLADPAHPGRALGSPEIPAILYWGVVAVFSVIAAGVVLIVRRVVAGTRHRAERDPHRLPGTATARDIRAAASAQALLKRAQDLRPSLSRPRAPDVGYRIGSSRGIDVWASVEDSILVLGPPRSGKGLHIVINSILNAPGAVVTTSTRPDNIAATIAERRKRGPVAVFDPQGLASEHSGDLRWSPIRGCDDPLTAMIRANGLASATGLSSGGVESGGFWEGKTRIVLQSLLHAAALDNRSPAELFGWTLAPAAAADAVAILSSHPQATTGWADAIESVIHADPRQRDSIWMGVSLALACLADPRVLDAVSPRPGEEFDPREFLTNNGTVYLLSTGAGAGASWALVAAFIEDLAETARHLAASSPRARLDPPLLLALDEIGNLAPLPSLPTLMAEGGGTGITAMPVLQSLSQARDRWGDHAANAIWDASIVKIILGGTSASRDLQDLSALIGDRDDLTDSTTIGDYGARSTQRSARRIPVMTPEAIRTLPFGTGLVLLRSTRPIISRLRPWHR